MSKRTHKPSLNAALEPLEPRQHLSGNHDIGINVNSNDADTVAKALPVLKSLGVTSVRLWYTLNDPSKHTISAGLARAIDYSNAGYDVTLTVHPKDGQIFDYGELKSWFKWAGGNAQIAKAVDRWEIGNEVDSSHYFSGTLKQYVNDYLKPASEGLHADGATVVSAGVSWNPEDVKRMIGYGMLDMVDAIGFHPYAKGVGTQKEHIQELEDVVDGRKPLIATEWNVRGFENDKTKWAAAVQDAYANVHAGFDLDYYYCLFAVDSPAGPAGLMYKDGSLNTPFYKSFLTASNGVGSTPPSTGGGDTGNSPSSTDTQIALYDADTDRVISGYTNLKSGQVIDLSKLPDHKLAIVVVPSKGATSVKMNFNGQTVIQSTAPYALFGDNDGDLNGQKLADGSYTLKATPYSGNGATGNAFATRTVNFSVVGSPSGGSSSGSTGSGSGGDSDNKAEVTSFSLVSATTGQVLGTYGHLTGDTTIDLSKLATRRVAVVANVDDDTKSVKLSGPTNTHVENTAPLGFFGDTGGKLSSWTAKAGSYYFAATAYSDKNAGGTKGTTLGLTIKFV